MAWWRKRGRAEFDREVLPHLPSLYATAMRLTRNDRDAEDLVQDALLRAFRFFHRYESGTNIRAWLFKILHNTFITRYHRRTREREMVAAMGVDPSVRPEEMHDPERAIQAGGLSEDVR